MVDEIIFQNEIIFQMAADAVEELAKIGRIKIKSKDDYRKAVLPLYHVGQKVLNYPAVSNEAWKEIKALKMLGYGGAKNEHCFAAARTYGELAYQLGYIDGMKQARKAAKENQYQARPE